MYKYTISLVEEHVKHRNKINEKGLQICQNCGYNRRRRRAAHQANSVLNLTLSTIK